MEYPPILDDAIQQGYLTYRIWVAEPMEACTHQMCNMLIRTRITALYDDRPSHNYIQQYTIYHVTTPSVSPPIDDATTTTHPGFTTTAIIYNNTPSIHVTTPSVSPPIDDATVVVVY